MVTARMISLLLLLLLLMPEAVCGTQAGKCSVNLMRLRNEPVNYYRAGDHLICGIISPKTAVFKPYNFSRPPLTVITDISEQKYWHILSFLLAVQEFNLDPSLLPNTTLGYNLFETYFDGRVVSNAMLDGHSGGGMNIPNYNCGRRKNLLAVIEGAGSDISTHVSCMSGIFKIPQLSYGFALTDKTQFPFAYQMVPKEEIQYRGIVKLLLHFGWTWIGLFAPDNDSGERFLSSLTPMMISSGICVAFSEKIQQRTLYQISILRKPPVMWRKVNVSVYYGDASNRFDPIIMVQRILERVQIWGKSGSQQLFRTST
ncbi:vomeronasal type-2 receptor 26-like [Podarcis lilfordi]|uniref:Vomeronasal type-2 receptor 26-like n=1 Tax=Podarcis lilfordi TaxID=74358 RepID=A0AA35JZ57_9SAUR|nr:vomeronasal type-2 receptor 26-like [Podarcis lilfordi]